MPVKMYAMTTFPIGFWVIFMNSANTSLKKKWNSLKLAHIAGYINNFLWLPGHFTALQGVDDYNTIVSF